MTIHTSTLVEDVEAGRGSASRSPSASETAQVDYLVIAAGRGADVEGLGLDEAGVELDEHGLVEGRRRAAHLATRACTRSATSCAGPALAHKASDEGIIAVEDAAGLETHPLEYVDIPRATFCTPNVASFGLTEAQAREAGHDVTVGKVQYGAVGAGTVYGDRTGLVKIVGDKQLRRAASAATSSAPRRPS